MTDIHYNRAPIIEAVIDLQVRFAAAPPQDAFAEVAKRLSATFPRVDPMASFGIQVGVGQWAPAPSASVSPAGLRLSTAKNERVLLLQPRGMTYSHLPPYTEWRTFRQEAEEMWEAFVEVTAPQGVNRLALRYINRFSIPENIFELSEYFLLRPEIPDVGMSPHVSAFFMQCQLPQADLGNDVLAFVNFGSAGASPESANYMLLDFDVVATRDVDVSHDTVFPILDQLRDRKNSLFEACITDKARELIR